MLNTEMLDVTINNRYNQPYTRLQVAPKPSCSTRLLGDFNATSKVIVTYVKLLTTKNDFRLCDLQSCKLEA